MIKSGMEKICKSTFIAWLWTSRYFRRKGVRIEHPIENKLIKFLNFLSTKKPAFSR